jgi:uncharacterized protein (UPF0276 family)
MSFERTIICKRKYLTVAGYINKRVLFDISQDNDDPAQLHIDKHNQPNIKEKYNLFQPIYHRTAQTMKMFAKETEANGEDSLITPFWTDTNRIEYLHTLLTDVLWAKTQMKA